MVSIEFRTSPRLNNRFTAQHKEKDPLGDEVIFSPTKTHRFIIPGLHCLRRVDDGTSLLGIPLFKHLTENMSVRNVT